MIKQTSIIIDPKTIPIAPINVNTTPEIPASADKKINKPNSKINNPTNNKIMTIVLSVFVESVCSLKLFFC